MKRASVDPAFTFGVSLVMSLVLWFPTLRATMRGDIDITDSGIRYCLALAIAWAGVYGVAALVAMYASQPREPTPPPGASKDQPQRRHDDPAHAEPQPTADEQEPSAA
jgi:hypothetical protein